MFPTDMGQEREEWKALIEATTLHMLPPEALIASVKYLAERLLLLTEGREPMKMSSSYETLKEQMDEGCSFSELAVCGLVEEHERLRHLLSAIVTSCAWENQGHGYGHIEIVNRQTFEEAALEAAQLVRGDGDG